MRRAHATPFLLAAIAVALLCTATAKGDPGSADQGLVASLASCTESFRPGTTVPVGTAPRRIAWGDLNGDSQPDLVVANAGSDDLTVIIADEAGAYFPPGGPPLAVGMAPVGVALADVDLDSRLDIVVANSGTNDVSVLLNDGAGGFVAAPGSPVSAGSGPAFIAVADFNADGTPDVVVVNAGSSNLTVLLGAGGGTFAPAPGSPVAVGTLPGALAIADFDGNGPADLAVTNEGSNSVTVLLGQGDGTFVPAAGSPVTVGTGPASVTAIDADNNGGADLVVANRTSNDVTVLLGDGAGGFSAAAGSPVAAGTGPASVGAHDFTMDGAIDLAVANEASNDVTLLMGDGTGGFTPSAVSPLAVGGGPASLVITDLNADSRADIAVAQVDADQVAILFGVCTATSATGAITPSSNPSIFGEPVSLTVVVSSTSPGGFTPTGEVTFLIDGMELGTAPLSGGTATLTTYAIPPGTSSIRAEYYGDSMFTGSTSPVLTQTVTAASTTTALDSSPNPSTFGETVTLTAMVSPVPPSQALPTGAVAFMDGGTTLGIVPLDVGVAVFTTSALAAGTRSLTAEFSGDDGFLGSVSPVVMQTVATTTSTTALSSSVNPSVNRQAVTFTATVTPPFGGTATGTVTFHDGATTLGTRTLAGGVATLTTSGLALGDHSIVAVYAGDANLAGSTSAPLVQTVTRSAAGDFDGDGVADILWRNVGAGPSAGTVVVWLMDGTAVAAASQLDPISPDWRIEKTGDFNGDGKADILWRQTSATAADSGALYIWLMDGAQTIAGTGYPNSQADFTWEVEAVGDLDGDGKTDILWRNVGPGPATGALFVWLMDGRTITGSAYLDPVSIDWQIERMADFNGDGKSDILWRERSSGSLFIWIMDGPLAAAGTGYTSMQADNTWQVHAVGDLDGDDKHDIVWRNVGPGSATGALAVWLMDGTTVTSATEMPPLSLDWEVQGLADFDGDGRSDILWREATSGNLYMWMMAGAAQGTGSGYTDTQADSTWDVRSPR